MGSPAKSFERRPWRRPEPADVPASLTEARARATQQGWSTWHALKEQLGRPQDGDVAVLITAADQVATVLATLGACDPNRTGGAQHSVSSSQRAAIATSLADSALPPAIRATLGDFFATLVELDIISTPVVSAPEPLDCDSPALHIPTAILYALRSLLFPAERMAIGSVRRVAGCRRLEAVFDVTGRATVGHVDADPIKLTRSFLAADASGTVYGFWAHSQPGLGAVATLPSPEDRNTFHRRLTAGDSPKMIAAIFADRYVRFFRANAQLELVDAGSTITLEGPGLRRLHDMEALYVFTD